MPPVAVILPPLVQAPSANQSSRLGARVDLLVWHETAGAYAGAVSWLRNPRSQVSAHLVIREDGREATQLVPLGRKAWHAAALNRRSIGVEHANTTAKGYATEAQLQRSARVFAWLCQYADLPPRWARAGLGAGICRHSDLGAAGGGHTSCGPGEGDWRRFLDMVRAELARGGLRREWAL